MTHAEIAYLVAVVLFAVAGIDSVLEKSMYAALIAFGLAIVTFGLLIA